MTGECWVAVVGGIFCSHGHVVSQEFGSQTLISFNYHYWTNSGTRDCSLIVGVVWDQVSGEGDERGIYGDGNIYDTYSIYQVGSRY